MQGVGGRRVKERDVIGLIKTQNENTNPWIEPQTCPEGAIALSPGF
jgi:hypothetical protein